MQLPRRSVRSIQELPSIYTAFPLHYKPVRTHSASTASDSARSPDIEDGLEVVPLERDSVLSALIVSAYQDEKEVFISGQQEGLEKPLPNVPASIWGRTWRRMSVKYRVFAILGLQAVILLTVGIALLAANSKSSKDDHSEIRRTGGNDTNTNSTSSVQRGTYLVPIQFPQQQSSKCLVRADELRAWQCAFDTTLQLSVLPSLGDNADTPVMITFGLPSNSNRSVHCGQQPPEIGPTVLTAINSSNEGAQFHFSATYNRIVVLREDQLRQEKTTSSPMQGQPKHMTFEPGQSLWRCTFDDTLLEGFIYVEKDGGSASDVTDTVSGASLQLPYKLKLTEQRAATGAAPYCEKVVVDVHGGLADIGERVDLELSGQSGPGLGQDEADASCQCQWVV